MKYKAKKYKLHDHFLTKETFHQMMTNLPEYVSEDEARIKLKEFFSDSIFRST